MRTKVYKYKHVTQKYTEYTQSRQSPKVRGRVPVLELEGKLFYFLGLNMCILVHS